MVSSAFANLFFSTAPLLSGDLDGCPALPTLGEDCVGGLASVAAVMRRSALAGDGPALFAPALDRQSRLVHVSYRNTLLQEQAKRVLEGSGSDTTSQLPFVCTAVTRKLLLLRLWTTFA